VAINAKSCEPNELTVPAGRSIFEIVNNSDRTVEWEILDGVMVLEERENIAPGSSRRSRPSWRQVNTRLPAGFCPTLAAS
jgi:iron uptake system EfeUOB component EfeO/EfeM